MRKYILLLLIVLAFYDGRSTASPYYRMREPVPTISAGLRIQKAMGFYWTSGITGEFCSEKFLKKKLSLGANFTTSVLGNGIRKNAIKTYELDLSAIKYFRPNKVVQPLARLNIGYMYAAYGKEFKGSIPNNAFLCSLEFGSAFIFNEKWKPSVGFGYNIITGNGTKGLATVFPLYGHVSWQYVF
ncbi:MAG: hypothetical protein Q8M29_15420 [Bacteroidota bacterium]|nr:hypothetical protein [Bacteroidota bacterium]